VSTNYTNITLYGIDQAAVYDWCDTNSVQAFISPTMDDVTVLYENTLAENAHLEKPLEALLAFGARLSVELLVPALVAVVMDDHLFMYVLFLDGQMIDSYVSYTDKSPVNGKPDILAETFDAESEIERIRAALNRELVTSATERHLELMDALNFPPMMIDMGFAYLDEGEKPHSVEDNNDVLEVGFEDQD
jgi:hypothetical protein